MPNLKRAARLMMVASDYIREHCPDQEIDFDGTNCDGLCLAGDLDSVVEMMDVTPAEDAAHDAWREQNGYD